VIFNLIKKPEFFKLAIRLFRMTIIVRISEHPVHIMRAVLTLIKVKSCNVLLCTLMVCTIVYLKAFLGYKFLILDNSYPDFICR